MLVVALLRASVAPLVLLAVRARLGLGLDRARLALRALQARELGLGLPQLALLRAQPGVLVLGRCTALALALALQRLLRLAQRVERNVLQALLQLALTVSSGCRPELTMLAPSSSSSEPESEPEADASSSQSSGS